VVVFQNPVSSGRRPPHLLVVDDDPLTTEHYARVLELEGFEVHTALDGTSALDEARKNRPDAVIVDLRMPSMDGLAFLRELNGLREGEPVPAAIITGDYLVDDATLREALGLTGRIVFKPVWIDDLVALAKSLVG
jgi:two-component system OmpR family response regulator